MRRVENLKAGRFILCSEATRLRKRGCVRVRIFDKHGLPTMKRNDFHFCHLLVFIEKEFDGGMPSPRQILHMDSGECQIFFVKISPAAFQPVNLFLQKMKA